LAFLMCLIALVAALGFAVAVPRRSANDPTPEVALLPQSPRAERERTAA
jgi:hypothetical protein